MTQPSYPLWSDEPAARDLLSFDAVAATVVDAVLDDQLDPIAIGLSGSWGSGKTTVLELVQGAIAQRSTEDGAKVLVIPTQPWRYDPAVGPKESLIAEVLDALSGELKPGVGDEAKTLLARLAGRVNWAKAFKVAAKAGIALQLPSVDDLLGLIREDPNVAESPERGLAGFREDFQELLASDGLKQISRVVVLVDDLDRCLPETVVETLEAIRLFLSARGMSFVIAADEDRVADAIQQRLQARQSDDPETETPAKLYLHKIVQTTIPLPGLSRGSRPAMRPGRADRSAQRPRRRHGCHRRGRRRAATPERGVSRSGRRHRRAGSSRASTAPVAGSASRSAGGNGQHHRRGPTPSCPGGSFVGRAAV
jgi:KAP family P-loop domain